MSEPRLKSGLRASAMIRTANGSGRSGMVLRRGDGDAGAILLVLRDRAGRTTVLTQTRTRDGEAAWSRGTGEEPVSEADADAYVARQVARDPDLWVLEIEGPDLQPPPGMVIV
ncbi:DUF1491 family protein [Acetobacteraceae bacterium KSS8]|uniref:DUF1491 family protein n=1 Tax=Endosaccharibacter trunci TaxID=2812733 RepID=A0ABT1W9C6_9PROT|nr:DUF1491 family protein [Acetobacteraceae bacterium KSS8]